MPVYIALGSNMGDPSRNVARALRALEGLSSTPVLKSSLWLTKPVDCPSGSPDFVNAAALIEPLKYENPESLLVNLLELEIGFGRRPKQVGNEPRPLDLDLAVDAPRSQNRGVSQVVAVRCQNDVDVLDGLVAIHLGA